MCEYPGTPFSQNPKSHAISLKDEILHREGPGRTEAEHMLHEAILKVALAATPPDTQSIRDNCQALSKYWIQNIVCKIDGYLKILFQDYFHYVINLPSFVPY